MSLLVPAFLAGLLALAIPLWVHLRNRRRSETVRFPSLMFLHQIPYRSVQRQLLQHRLLLAARALALALLALAFARPFMPSEVQGLDAAGAREVVIVLDDSWSMGYGDRWDQATAQARRVLAGLGSSDRVSLVLFSSEPRVAARSMADASDALAALSVATPGSGTTSYTAGLRAARRILAESTLPRRLVVLISDFQKSGWDPDTSVQMPAGTTVRPIWVGGSAANISVADIDLRVGPGGEDLAAATVAVGARITSQGLPAGASITARLEVEGAPAQSRSIDVPANGSVRVSFDPVVIGDHPLRATLYAGDDLLPADNEMHFVIPVGRGVGVLLLDHPAGTRAGSFYIERALKIGARPLFRVDREVLGALGSRDLAGYDLVVLNDAGNPNAGSLAALLAYTRSGGGVLVVLGERTEPGPVEELFTPFGIGEVVDRTVELGAKLATLDTTHPALELFARPGSGDFTAAHFYRYRALVPEPVEGVLARFDDGRAALVESSIGEGRVLVWTSILDMYWNDFARQPVFLPFIQQVARYVAGYREPRPWLKAAQPVGARQLVEVASAGSATRASGVEVVATSGQRVNVAAGETTRLETGFYRVAWTGGDEGAGDGWIAVNLDRAEADLTPMDPEEVAAAVVWRAGGSVEQQLEQPPDPGLIERRQSVWWYLLIAVFLLLTLETALSNRVSSRAS